MGHGGAGSTAHDGFGPRRARVSLVAYARTTGALYLLIIAIGLWSELLVRSALVVRGDAGATAANIASSLGLFRLGFAGDVVVFLADVAVAVLLYVLLRRVSDTLSLAAAAFRLVGTAIYGANLLNHLAAVLLQGGAGYLQSLEPGELNALTMFFLETHRHGYDLGLVFFGLHCLVLGYLLFRSFLFPKALGVLMVLSGVGYLVGSFTLFLMPRFEAAVAPVYIAPLVGELAFTLWLLVKGVRRPRPATDGLTAA